VRDDGWATPVGLGQPPEIRRVGAERGQQPVDEGVCIRRGQQRIVGLLGADGGGARRAGRRGAERSGAVGGRREPKILLLWWHGDDESSRDLDRVWRAYIRRFGIEMSKPQRCQTCGWALLSCPSWAGGW
jgi:hypothetical protein